MSYGQIEIVIGDEMVTILPFEADYLSRAFIEVLDPDSDRQKTFDALIEFMTEKSYAQAMIRKFVQLQEFGVTFEKLYDALSSSYSG